MNYLIKINNRMFWDDIINSFGVAKGEKLLATVLGVITLTQLSTLISILIIASGGVVSILFAVRKHLKREEKDFEIHVLAIIERLTKDNLLDNNLPLEEKRKIAINYINQVNQQS